MKTDRERLREIATTLASYGFGHIVRTRIRPSKESDNDAANLRKAFEDLGPTFIKFGQILSTRRDLLSHAYIKELEKLRDDAPQFPFSEVERIFVEDFQKPLGQVFAYIDAEPLASASISQVHRATLKDGQKVIIKAQRPYMEENLLRDIRLFRRLVKFAPYVLRDMFIDADAALEEIEETTKIELDFRNEARNINRFQETNQDIEVIATPDVIPAYVSKRIIVEEFVEGIRNLNQHVLKEEGYDPVDIGEKLVYSFLTQVFRDGFFHADPHPGNIIIRDQKITFIDFGLMGELSESIKADLIKMLRAIVLEDVDLLLNLLMQMTTSKQKIDRFKLREDVFGFFYTYINRDLSSIDMGQLFTDLLEVTREHKMVMPNNFITLGKALVMVEGVVSDLSPEINIMEVATTYMSQFEAANPLTNLSREKVAIEGYRVSKDLIGLPKTLRETLDVVKNGYLQVHLDLANFDDKWTGLNKMVNRLILSLIIVALILASALITTSATGGLAIFGAIVFLVAGLLGVILIISIFRSGNL